MTREPGYLLPDIFCTGGVPMIAHDILIAFSTLNSADDGPMDSDKVVLRL